MKKLFFLAIAATIMLFSCSKNTSDPNDPVEVRFSGNIAQLQTRVGETTWDNADKVGIFMTSPYFPSMVWTTEVEKYYANKDYTTTAGATANFFPVDGQPMYYPQDGSKVDFFAYYPYSTTIDYNTVPYYYPSINIDATDQSDLSAIDILWASAKGVDKTSGPISLSFRHCMTKLVFNISYGEDLVAPEDNNFDITVFDVQTIGQLIISQGNILPIYGIPKAEVTASEKNKIEMILPPQTHTGIAVAIEDANGDTFKVVIPDGTWNFNTIYTYNVTLKKAGVAALISGTIQPWGIGTPIDIDGFLEEE